MPAGPSLVAHRDSIMFGNPWTGVIQLYAPNSILVQTFRLTGLSPKPIPKDIKPWIVAKDGTPLKWEAKVKNMPYFERIHIASNGDIWYNDFPMNNHEERRWYGFTRRGAPLGTLTIDSALVVNQSVAVEEFGASSVLLRFDDAVGTKYRIVPFSNLIAKTKP